MKLTKQEAENILNMMLSTDAENGYVAFKAIEAHTFTKNDFGYLIYFYKFSKYTTYDWKNNAPSAYKMLSSHFNLGHPLTYAQGLATMIAEKNDKETA